MPDDFAEDLPEGFEILDNRPSHLFMQLPDGSTEMFTKSRETRLLFDYGLWDVLKERSRVLTFEHPATDSMLELVPEDDSAFRLRLVIDNEAGRSEGRGILLSEQHVSNLIDALAQAYIDAQDPPNPDPLVRLYQSYQDSRARPDVLESVHETVALFRDNVEVREDGWLINGHLLLDYGGEFYHPGTTSRERSGGVVDTGSAEPAYKLETPQPPQPTTPIEVDGMSAVLTDIEQRFIALATWAVIRAPNTRSARRRWGGDWFSGVSDE